MIFGAAAAMSLTRLSGVGAAVDGLCDVALRSGLLEAGAEGVEAGQSDDAHNEEQNQAKPEQAALGIVARDDAPFCSKKPDAVRKVPGGGDQTNHIEGKQPDGMNFVLHLEERLRGDLVQVDAGEAHGVGVPDDVD